MFTYRTKKRLTKGHVMTIENESARLSWMLSVNPTTVNVNSVILGGDNTARVVLATGEVFELTLQYPLPELAMRSRIHWFWFWPKDMDKSVLMYISEDDKYELLVASYKQVDG